MKRIVLFIFLIFPVVSCEKFLEENPKDRLAETNFYKTLEDLKSAVNAIYQPVPRIVADNWYLQIEIPADYAYGRGSTMPIGGEYTGLDATNIARVADMWANFYRAINYANIAIEKIQESTVNESDKTALVAEARFLRAFFYYELVRDFGAVPLIVKTGEGDKKRTPVNEVYDEIILDLQAAESDLPSSISQYGHPSKWSAKTLLADVYLTTEKWSLAKDKAKEVLDANVYALVEVQVADDFDKLFGASANGTKEEIFYIKYSHNFGSTIPFYLLWANTTFSPYGAYVLYSDPTNPFMINWDNNDLRKKWSVFTEYVNSITGKVEQLVFPPMCFSKFRDHSAPNSRAYANDLPIFRYADVLLIYAEAADIADNGPSVLAIECLNNIKRRAYGYPSKAPSPVDYSSTGWTVDSFRNTVLQERAYEFLSEGKRWKDLKRSGKAKEVILANKGKTVADRFMLWPIPQQEIDTNSEINQEDQNPGY